MVEKTKPKTLFPEGRKPNPSDLAGGKYGTYETVQIWGPEKTFEYSLRVQGQAALTLSKLHPDIMPPEHAQEINEKANLQYVNPNRIRELEEKTGHDVIAVNTSLEEIVSKEAGAHINKARTSADTTQSAKALQIKASLEVIADSLENIRDIIIEKAVEWISIPHMDTTHLLDALPTVAGRPFSHYAEMLQSNLSLLNFFYNNSIMGKWSDATGSHHSSKTLGIDGLVLEEQYCKDLGIKHMIAPAQIPGLEFEADIFYIIERTSETLNNIAEYIAWGKSGDVNIFRDTNPKKRKGSSGMPHKDVKGGNPTTEEQVMSVRNYSMGNMTTALANCRMNYARNLAASANTRINFEDGFKFIDHGIRKLAEVVYWLGLNEERCRERVSRTYGIVTSEQVLTYLTDRRKVINPMTRSEAHNLLGELATLAYEYKTDFVEVLLKNKKVSSRIDSNTLKEITNPFNYIGESKRIVEKIAQTCYLKKTL